MDLLLIGTFITVADAEAAIERMEELKTLADLAWSDSDWRNQNERMPRTLTDELARLGLYDMGRADVDNYAFDHSVERSGATVRIRTEESEIQGFVKLVLHLGGRVEVLSGHHWNDDGTPKTATGG
ncbi:DUF6375 family protein [Cryptosporangium minutisporangium]